MSFFRGSSNPLKHAKYSTFERALLVIVLGLSYSSFRVVKDVSMSNDGILYGYFNILTNM